MFIESAPKYTRSNLRIVTKEKRCEYLIIKEWCTYLLEAWGVSTQAFEWQAMACLQGHMHVIFLVHELGYACVILLCWIEGRRFPPPYMTSIQGPHRKKKVIF